MHSDRQQRVERICHEALERQGAARADYLAVACGGDEELRREVDSLLAFENAAAHFIKAPAIQELARALGRTPALQNGARVGPYEIVSPVGSGGMGEVYRARDTKLHRDVAIKVLPPLFLADSDRKARFEHEARMLAAVNDPHIAAIYGIDDSDGVPALILEFVEGETLDALLAGSPGRRLPMAKALGIARQIAEALEAAHARGIVHRDLKPSNIKITADERVKVLDFGLAAALVPLETRPAGSADIVAADNSPRLIVGTPAYMSPEQAHALPTDKRADVWAFGCVVFEMLAGTPVFDGASSSATLGDVVARDPDWTALPDLPEPIVRLLRRCLQRERKQRLADMADARLEIDEALANPNRQPTAPRRHGAVRERVAWVVAAVGAIAAVAALWWPPSERAGIPVVRFPIDVLNMGDPIFISISPDGRFVLYPATHNGKSSLWVRPLDSLEARALPGTEGLSTADWSPDSRFLVFASDAKLKILDINGGPPEVLTTVKAPVRRASWNRDGIILFNDGDGISRIAATGGTVTPVTTLDPARRETNHSTPWFLPDGRHFLYTAWSLHEEFRTIYVASLDSKERKRLMSAESKAIYSPPGYILFRRGAQLMAQPFDADRLAFTGDAAPVADSISFFHELGQTAFYASAQGTLIFVANPPPDLSLFWAGRTGTLNEVSTSLRGARNPVLANDGERIAFYRGGTPDLWIHDVVRSQTRRLTTSSAADRFPLFSPDGARVVFASNPGNLEISSLYEKPSHGAAPEHDVLLAESGVMAPRGWGDRGAQLVFEKGGGFGQQRDIWVLPQTGGGKPYPYIATDSDERHPVVSPDGRWLAYSSNESGEHEVVVQPFPDRMGAKYPIGAGRFPRWRPEGGELYYVDDTGWLIAVSVRTNPAFEIRGTQRLFELPFVPGTNDLDHPYDVAADGQRFLVTASLSGRPSRRTTTINVLLGWPSLLQRATQPTGLVPSR